MTTLFRPAVAAGLFALALALAGGPAAAQAPSPEQIKVAREVIEASGASRSLDNIVPIFMDEAKQTFTRTRPEISAKLDEALKAIEPEFAKRREDLMNDIASVYASRFTLQELTEIKAFYKTSTGVKLVQNLPEVLRQSYGQTEAWSRKMSQDIVTRLRQEMRKRGEEI